MRDLDELDNEWKSRQRLTLNMTALTEIDRQQLCYLYNHKHLESKKFLHRIFKALKIIPSLYRILEYDAGADPQDFFPDQVIDSIYFIVYNFKSFGQKPLKKRLFPIVMKHFKRGVFNAGCMLGLLLKNIEDEYSTLIIESIIQQLENPASSNLTKSFLIHLLSNGLSGSAHKSGSRKTAIYKVVHSDSVVKLLENNTSQCGRRSNSSHRKSTGFPDSD